MAKKRAPDFGQMLEILRLNKELPAIQWSIKPPEIMRGVVPDGMKAPVLAMDDMTGISGWWGMLAQCFPANTIGFPGFPYLSQLATRAEYRAFAAALSTEYTREWIKFDSKQDDEGSTDKINKIEAEFTRLDIRGLVRRSVEHDSFFGRSHLFIEIDGADLLKPLIMSPKTVPIGSLRSVRNVEPMWTTPANYNALQPWAPDFYKPTQWFIMGSQVHASRLLTIVSRELPDMLKPAFNFAGMSLSQLAEPYVNNWLRTRQSVADLINNFSITALKTSMSQILQHADADDSDIFKRAELFTAMRANKGLMLLDEDTEDLVQINTPLGGLHELQAQAQEHMCSVSRIPAMVLTGISPTGFNASSEGEIRVFYDWIAAGQEANYRTPLEIILKLVQLNLFSEIDPDINFHFVPLYQMTAKELAEIRKSDCDAAVAYINAGVIDGAEERERLANDPESGYQGLDLAKVIESPNAGMEDDEAENT